MTYPVIWTNGVVEVRAYVRNETYTDYSLHKCGDEGRTGWLAECHSPKIWKSKYKSSPEVFAEAKLNERMEAIYLHNAKLQAQIMANTKELAALKSYHASFSN